MAHNLIHDIAGLVKGKLDQAYTDMRADATSLKASNLAKVDTFTAESSPLTSASLATANTDLTAWIAIEEDAKARMDEFFDVTLPNSTEAADGIASFAELAEEYNVWTGSFAVSHSQVTDSTAANLAALNTLYGSADDFDV